ncbi:hypothetical protein B0T17DRAFT_611956 [Bombardia bombarda]|uniref:Uncharacterized protein n=1 Tax=Bombardia bombarda TaxID=252184 RepID=A0AA39XJ80_9PEZI|nr:hypothetical protein B0T17DRAFT_611956 [Bombardia bombarda]
MQFAKYLAVAMAVAMPALALPTVNNRSLGARVEIAGRSYLIVNKAEADEEEGTILSRAVALLVISSLPKTAPSTNLSP